MVHLVVHKITTLYLLSLFQKTQYFNFNNMSNSQDIELQSGQVQEILIL